MDTSKLKTFLTWIGLWKAIKGYPALLILILVSVALLELIAHQAILLLPGLSVTTLHLFIVIIGILLGLTGYFAGDFWDSRFFDPHYGIEGKWLHSHTRPFNVFPAGTDLKQYRDQAIQALFGKEHSGEGIYREAKKVAKRQAKNGTTLSNYLFCRNLCGALSGPASSFLFLLFWLRLGLLSLAEI
jgi:hypothetical protein